MDFFSHPLNAELATLLVVCPIDEAEKRLWLEKMPDMNEEEKTELRDNLREEFNHYAVMQKISTEMLMRKIKEITE